MFFQTGMSPLMTPVPHVNKLCALTNLYSKTKIFALLHENAFSERKLFLNTLQLYLLERHVFWEKNHSILNMAKKLKMSFENLSLIPFFQC